MTTKSVKLRLTLVCEYVADPAHYGNASPEEMAKIDEDNFALNSSLLSELEYDTVRVEVLK